MNWKLETDLFYWQVEGTPFGVEKIDSSCYVPFRLWGRERVYMGVYDHNGKRKDLIFSSRREAMRFVEGKVKEYLESVITAS